MPTSAMMKMLTQLPRSLRKEHDSYVSITALASGRDAGGFWAITCFFNPMRFRRRSLNYRRFREGLKLPLVTVELAYGPQFELGEADAEVLVQLRGGPDVLWQKERLLNLALEALPPGCSQVAWLDCDVVFEADDWPERTRALLDRFALVQPFSHLHQMPRDWEPGQGRASGTGLLHSVPFLIASGVPMATCLGTTQSQLSPGHAWAADRKLLENHALYDACIIGGGDIAIARAAYGCFDFAIRRQHLNPDHYRAWAEPFHDAVRGKVGCLEGDLFHLWHGETEHRRYLERNEGMARHRFDPFQDIALDASGAWRWSSENPGLHAWVRDYFASRRENG
jgi:hypothetical protein